VRWATVRRIGGHRPVFVTALLLAGWLAFQGWAWSSGGAKLREAGLEDTAGNVHVELVLGIVPEPFHMALFQDAGRLIAVRAPSVFMMDVPPEKLRSLAAHHWVRAIRPWVGI
jgi:hypothetical protein